MDSGKHKLSSKYLRIVNGERDIYAFYQLSRVRAASIAVTGKRCDSFAYSCLNPNGSGWVMVRNSQVRDRSADHCFQRASGDCDGNQDVLDANWKSGRASWTWPANLNWLKTFARP